MELTCTHRVGIVPTYQRLNYISSMLQVLAILLLAVWFYLLPPKPKVQHSVAYVPPHTNSEHDPKSKGNR